MLGTGAGPGQPLVSEASMRVKICGITGIEDARIAVDSGADAIGVIVGTRHRAEDAVLPQEARRIVDSLPPFVTSVLVTHFADAGSVAELCDEVRPDVVQLQGEITVAEMQVLRQRLGGGPLPHRKDPIRLRDFIRKARRAALG